MSVTKLLGSQEFSKRWLGGQGMLVCVDRRGSICASGRELGDGDGRRNRRSRRSG